jgi:drug/metabolite transporter (DMT)-like permease
VGQQATHPWAGTPLLWLGILYLGVVCTAVAFFLWNKGFEYLPAGTGGLFLLAQPLVGSVLGRALLGEQLGLAFFAGSALIVAGVVVATAGR